MYTQRLVMTQSRRRLLCVPGVDPLPPRAQNLRLDKGKPDESQGRKATGPRLLLDELATEGHQDRRAANPRKAKSLKGEAVMMKHLIKLLPIVLLLASANCFANNAFGVVLCDTQPNGYVDELDTPLEGVGVELSGQGSKITDADGNY